MEFVYAPSAGNGYYDDGAVVKRRSDIAHSYASLPIYASKAFWQTVETADIPLEVLVCALRHAMRLGDEQGRKRLVGIIIQRTQVGNERWAEYVLSKVVLRGEERTSLMCDLCADLYESMLRALMDPARAFWEENFLHCLRFERKHVYRSFMMREGRWQDQQVKRSVRVPHALLARLHLPARQMESDVCAFDIEDEQAQKMLLAVERSEVLHLVLHLPDKLKSVILLVFWEGRTEKETAQVLGITDRTVRNRIRDALQLLREVL